MDEDAEESDEVPVPAATVSEGKAEAGKALEGTVAEDI